ncbi:YdhR family protein [Parahaliea mediterranea]|uniref:YdhR family protein n=1 Tax=Parahaliea mediterranea TaxID=651086 RepID=A0A939ILK4_9GAMM|nr:YdhR family protein [Parahaliea mediterranea]MBN7796068.1 YdhR family protein [Parahaliea mediterranea]
MITAITRFALPQPVSPEQAKSIFLTTAHKYQNVPGLFRKCYVLSDDGRTVGGIYLWRSREDAEAVYTDSWKAFVLEKYGSQPEITYLDTPLVVDNVAGEIISD